MIWKCFHATQNRWTTFKNIIETFSKDICMDFGIDKCTLVHTKGGVIFESPYIRRIYLLSGEIKYKYLCILECDTILLKEVNYSVRKDYLSKLLEIGKLSVIANNTITHISEYIIPLPCYSFGVILWTQAELWELDMKTQKVLEKDNFYHDCSDVHQIYLFWWDRGCGIFGVVDIL